MLCKRRGRLEVSVREDQRKKATGWCDWWVWEFVRQCRRVSSQSWSFVSVVVTIDLGCIVDWMVFDDLRRLCHFEGEIFLLGVRRFNFLNLFTAYGGRGAPGRESRGYYRWFLIIVFVVFLRVESKLAICQCQCLEWSGVEESDLGSTRRLDLLYCLLRVKSVSNLGCDTAAATIRESKSSDLEGDVRRLLRSWNTLSYALPFLLFSFLVSIHTWMMVL